MLKKIVDYFIIGSFKQVLGYSESKTDFFVNHFIQAYYLQEFYHLYNNSIYKIYIMKKNL